LITSHFACIHGLPRRQIDVIVVYKVDRLTRSLADFAKLVELFDARGVSFVSVTQAFNTTTSMGRAVASAQIDLFFPGSELQKLGFRTASADSGHPVRPGRPQTYPANGSSTLETAGVLADFLVTRPRFGSPSARVPTQLQGGFGPPFSYGY
jgi:hypothetical protein